MIFKKTFLKDLYLIKIKPAWDIRGFFARYFCQQEFHQHKLDFRIVQSSISYNKSKGTLRGMHYQSKPYEEEKLVGCIKGSIYDVVIDLRQNSSTFNKWQALTLTEGDYQWIYIPKGFAHGFQTLKDNTVIMYHMSEYYFPQAVKGIRWNDSFFNISWPIADPILTQRDAGFSDYKTTESF